MLTYENFDLYRIFFGSGAIWISLLEILFRTFFLYLYALLNVRIIGKQGIAQLSPLQFIFAIALGSAIGDPMFYQDVPLIHGMLVITTIILLEKATIMLMGRHTALRTVLEGWPALVVKDGKVIMEELRRQGLTLDELHELLRLKGIKYTGQVEYAFWESSGNLSVIPREKPEKDGHLTVEMFEEKEKQI